MFWNQKKTLNKNSSSDNFVSTPSVFNLKEKTNTKLPLSFLKRLVPIGHLPDNDLQKLKTTFSQYKPGDIIFNRGETSTSLNYIVKGQCFIEIDTGPGYKIDTSTLKAYYPLSSDSQHQCTAIAQSDVNIIGFPHNAIQNCYINTRNALLNNEDIPENLQNNLFFNKFLQYYKQGELVIPSLPDVAFKLRAAVQKDIGIEEAVKILNLDPVIASKLIQAVNSPLYRTINPITTCHDAVNRLGLITTRNLVTSISMKNLFKSKNKELNKTIHNIWKQSIRVSSISHALAALALNKKINPDEALLAGLIYNIGSIPIIIFANTLPGNEYSIKDLNLTITTLQGLLGNIILKKWAFADALVQVPRQTENWFHRDSEELNLSDIVLLAKYHSYITSKQMQHLPPIQTLPAFQKLGDNTLTPDMSLQSLHDAKQQISDAISLLNA
jgi:HD-like signal output (HDOD) protein